MSLKTRLKTLEIKQSQLGIGQPDRDAWLSVFEEFGLSPDRPIPIRIPVINCIINSDGTDTGTRLLRIDGETIERKYGAANV
jgi:hypothetical protein